MGGGSLHLSDLNISSVTPNSYSDGNTTIEDDSRSFTNLTDDSIFTPHIAHSGESHTLNMGPAIETLHIQKQK